MTKTDPAPGPERLRADKWLWYARFFKTRSLAAEMVAAGKVRVNGSHIRKPSHALRPGDTLTFAQGRAIRVVRVLALSTRRGPAQEAQALYEDLEAPKDRAQSLATGGARPTKKDRRRLAQTRPSALE